MKKIIFIVILMCYFFTFPQEKNILELEKIDLVTDFDLLVDIIKKQHPNPYKFIDQNTFNKKVDSLRFLLEKSPTIYNFMLLSPIALLRDVHTNAFFNSALSIEINKSLRFFPIPLCVEKGRVIVNYNNNEIPFGSEVISINDEPVQELMKIFRRYCDGYIPCDLSSLDCDLSLVYPSVKNYKIEYILPNTKKKQEIELKSLNYSAFYYRKNKSVIPYNLLERNAGAIYGHIIDEDKMGILTVNSFLIDESLAYKKFHDFFVQINNKEYNDVIIDIRSNKGGYPSIAALLYSFISKETFHNQYNYQTKSIELAYPEYIVDNNNKKISEEELEDRKNFMYQRFDGDSISGFYIGNSRLDEGFVEKYPKSKNAFKGRIFVLISNQTISSATYFATLVKKNERGMLIGKETGSGMDATTAVWFLKYKLPKTKRFVSLPLSEIYFFNASKDRGRGVIPDKELDIDQFMEYLLEGKDPELEYTLNLIKK